MYRAVANLGHAAKRACAFEAADPRDRRENPQLRRSGLPVRRIHSRIQAGATESHLRSQGRVEYKLPRFQSDTQPEAARLGCARSERLWQCEAWYILWYISTCFVKVQSLTRQPERRSTCSQPSAKSRGFSFFRSAVRKYSLIVVYTFSSSIKSSKKSWPPFAFQGSNVHVEPATSTIQSSIDDYAVVIAF